ncbi:MAG: hypothetical protein CMF58_02290 [Lentimicrobiaceae bacterium]|nr:hypothetical protein [Lentimicrobiaceae bacterium]|tara:strand:- start:1751 stop:4774 length:3024 start_codon:yes stop_codon:yes gene_type:complete
MPINISIGLKIIKLLNSLVSYFILASLFTMSINSQAQIVNVGGVIENDRIFYKDTTYIVVQDLIIPKNRSLTISPGTVIKINFGRNIIVDNGSFYAIGNQSDSIYFLSNYTEPNQIWKWNGLQIKNSDYENPSILHYLKVFNAETAITLENSINVQVENTFISGSQNAGINIINSSFCYIVNCAIKNNYNGVEIHTSDGGLTANNLVSNSFLKNENHNINIFIEQNGKYVNNQLNDNIISQGNNGIWIDNGGNTINYGNSITKNVIINNGGDVGYGLFLAHDSIIVSNNIFWNNNTAIFTAEKGKYCGIVNNSFYENRWALAIGGGSLGNNILNNTFSENIQETISIKETSGINIETNNLVNNSGENYIVINNTPDNISIPGNYWGTDIESKISKLIYDRNDNPDVGDIVFKPYLDSINNRNPISPPYNVIKQLVDNVVRVSWMPNPETDLNNYYLYYGNYKDYKFTSDENIGKDTLVSVSGDISIYDIIAVTSQDTTNHTSSSQLNGNESPYAFARLYPFAGDDTLVCKYVNSIHFDRGSIPFDYESLFWTTNGDGIFDSYEYIFPIYIPGEEDINAGGALITLNVITVTDTISDSFMLRMINEPIAFAGNDTIIVADTSILIEFAHAYNFQSLLWLTSGDGVFDNDTIINPTYTPGPIDTETGNFVIELIVTSECGSTSDSMLVAIEPHFSIEGRLWTSSNTAYDGTIVAYRKDNISTRAFLIETSQDDGNFRFPKVMRGGYYVYALPDTNNIDNLVPGYYAHKRHWDQAHIINVDANVYDLDIFLSAVDYVLPEGEATISGNMVMPEKSNVNGELYCQPWLLGSNLEYCIGGLSNITVFLFDQTYSKLMDYTLTNEFGNFYFNDLPFGKYIIDAEKAGYYPIPSTVITTSPDNPNISGIKIEIADKNIGVVPNSIKYQLTGSLDVYPNPASNSIKVISFLKADEDYSIRIFSYNGVEMTNKLGYNNNQNGVISIQVELLPSGLYFGNIKSNSSVNSFYFIIRDK